MTWYSQIINPYFCALKTICIEVYKGDTGAGRSLSVFKSAHKLCTIRDMHLSSLMQLLRDLDSWKSRNQNTAKRLSRLCTCYVFETFLVDQWGQYHFHAFCSAYSSTGRCLTRVMNMCRCQKYVSHIVVISKLYDYIITSFWHLLVYTNSIWYQEIPSTFWQTKSWSPSK